MAHPVTPNFPSLASLIQACKIGLAWLPRFCLLVGFAHSASALTLHRSFRTREAGFGFGAGTATVAYPVDAKVAAAFDEASKKHLSEYVFGKDVNHQMVKDGYAWHYKLYYKTPSYAEAEDVRGKKQELWQAPNPVEPFQYRKMKKGTK